MLIRIRPWLLAMALVLALGSTSLDLQAQDAVKVGDRTQLFIDGRYVTEDQNVRIVVCPPIKTGEECLVGSLRGYGSIMAVDGTYRGFTALSKDGVKFRRVNHGTQPASDDIVGYINGQTIVFEDPKAPAEERYKLTNPAKNSLHSSADGVKWKQVPAEGMFPKEAHYPRGMDSQNVIFYDTNIGKYVAYVRQNMQLPVPPEREAYFAPVSKRNYGKSGFMLLRAVARAESDDPTKFPMPEVVFTSDEKDPHYGGVNVMDFYNPNVMQYEHAQDAYFLISPRYLHYEDWYLSDDLSKYPASMGGKGQLNTGPEDMGFAASRDGISWNRYDRKPWIELGMEGAFDSKSMYPARGMVVQGNEIWMYYTAYDTLHADVPDKKIRPVLGRVVLRKDGFTAVEADYAGGEFTTPSLLFEGDALHLNVNTSAVGLLRVEIQDANGKPIDGYSLDDCDRVHTANTIDRIVTWKGSSDVSALAGKPVRLRFELKHGVKLHAFRFGPSETTDR